MSRGYFSPSKDASDFFGITLHDDWGMTDHAFLQEMLLPTGAVQDGYDEWLVEMVIENCDNTEFANSYSGFDRYHVAFGMISQFCREDIEYFINNRYPDRPKDIEERTDRLRDTYNGKLQWVLSPGTLEKLERHLEKEAA